MPTLIIAAAATIARIAVLKGKSTVCRNPYAMPEFGTCVKSMNPGITVVLAYRGSFARTSALVSWSSTTMRIGSQISMRRDNTPCAPRRGFASGIGRLGERVLTAFADAGPGRIGRNRLDVSPAAFALHAVRPLDGDLRRVAAGTNL